MQVQRSDRNVARYRTGARYGEQGKTTDLNINRVSGKPSSSIDGQVGSAGAAVKESSRRSIERTTANRNHPIVCRSDGSNRNGKASNGRSAQGQTGSGSGAKDGRNEGRTGNQYEVA